MEGRFGRGRTRLLEKEDAIAKERDMSKRLGKVLPEETVKVPKIGEWTLNADELDNNNNTQNETNTEIQSNSNLSPPQNPISTQQQSQQQKSKPLINVRPFPRNVPLNTSQKQRIAKVQISQIQSTSTKPRSKSNLAPVPFHAPKLPNFVVPNTNYNPNSLQGRLLSQTYHPTENRVIFPAGTVTTDLKDILRSKYLIPTQKKSSSLNKLYNLNKVKPNNSQNELESENDNIINNFEDPKFLPLEVFDDKKYEEFSIEELMKNPTGYSKISDKGQIR